jgi:hypothetical protein
MNGVLQDHNELFSTKCVLSWCRIHLLGNNSGLPRWTHCPGCSRTISRLSPCSQINQ